jgi:GNAT superfamily N-acetyltransferase
MTGSAGHSTEEILRAAAEWTWLPRGAESQNDELLLVRYPERFGGGVRGSQVRSALDATGVVTQAIERTRAWGESVLTIWTSGTDAPDIEEELRRHGAEHIDTVAVFACPTSELAPEVPRDVSTERVETLEQVRDVDRVNVAVWGQQPLDERGLQEELAEVRAALSSRVGARVLARVDDVPLSTGGFTMADGFARLWGAATLDEYRGRGAYRAVLAERIRLSREWGATTALVKGRISTSAPILARVGFHHYGDERAYRLTLG